MRNKILYSLTVLILKSSWAFAQEVQTRPVSKLAQIVDWIVEAVVKYSFQAIGGFLVLIIGWILSRFAANFVEKFLAKHKLDITVQKFLISTVKLLVMACAILIALSKFGFEIAPFIAGLSVVGFGTSFALQGPLSNYAAGASLIFTKPFKVGDIIEVAGEMGEVEDISLPRTQLRTVDGTIVVIPNKHIIGEIIHNFSDLKKLEIKVTAAFKSDLSKSVEIVKAAIKNESRIAQDKEPKVGIYEFGESGAVICTRVWCKQSDYWDTLFSLNMKIFNEFRKNNIEISYPQRDIHMSEKKG